MIGELVKAKDLTSGDVLLEQSGEAWPTWSNGEPIPVLRVEHIVRVTFANWTRAEWFADHELDRQVAS